MLKKIMVALDGSENAEHALEWAKRYAGREKAQIVLFRAVDPALFEPEALPSNLTDAKNYLLRMEADINQAGHASKVIVRQGKPAPIIARTAMEERCDLILMTTRGGSKVKRWVIGGVTEQVLRLSPIPVLPLRTDTRAPRNNHVRRVVVPVDGSKFAEMAIPWAIGLAKMLKARLVFLHVCPSGPAGMSSRSEENFEALRLRMVRQTRLLEKEGLKARFAVRSGDAADRVLKFCGKNDLVITTTHGAGGFKRWIFGSVAEKLIHEARIPVLVYKTFAQLKDEILTA